MRIGAHDSTLARGAGLVLLAGLTAAGGCNKSDDGTPAPSGPGPATQPAPISPPPSTQAAATARPSTQPGRLGPGDLLVVTVSDIAGAGTETGKAVRIQADGGVRLAFLPNPIHVAGLTPADAQDAVAAAYREANIVRTPIVYVRRLQVGGPGAVGAGPIGKFDLIRVDIGELAGPGVETTRIVRVDGDGIVGLPFIGKQTVAGLTEGQAEQAIGREYVEKNIVRNPAVSVLVLEPAPPDAGRMDLPDAPVGPVPDLLRPLFDLPPTVSAGFAARGR